MFQATYQMENGQWQTPAVYETEKEATETSKFHVKDNPVIVYPLSGNKETDALKDRTVEILKQLHAFYKEINTEVKSSAAIQYRDDLCSELIEAILSINDVLTFNE